MAKQPRVFRQRVCEFQGEGAEERGDVNHRCVGIAVLVRDIVREDYLRNSNKEQSSSAMGPGMVGRFGGLGVWN